MDETRIAEWLRIFVEPGQITELRALEVSDGRSSWTRTEAGFFDYEHLNDMARIAVDLSFKKNAIGVYFVPNPINPDLLARCANKTKPSRKTEQLTTDKDIIKRKWLLIDADPRRSSGISATDAEKEQAKQVVCRVWEFFAKAGCWSPPVLADSGNGYHMMYETKHWSIDDSEIAKDILERAANNCSTADVAIDTSVFNPARIVKLYGTRSSKGDSTNTRPHRISKVIHAECTAERLEQWHNGNNENTGFEHDPHMPSD